MDRYVVSQYWINKAGLLLPHNKGLMSFLWNYVLAYLSLYCLVNGVAAKAPIIPVLGRQGESLTVEPS